MELIQPTRPASWVAGVDGSRAGWVVARLAVAGDESATIGIETSFDRLVSELFNGALVGIAVDMPIGLATTKPRASDAIVRKRLGVRRASLFPTPPRGALNTTDYATALVAARAAFGRGISKQTYNLLPRIREIDEVVSPDLFPRVCEAHPETSFVELTGAPLSEPKRTALGLEQRINALSSEIPNVAQLVADRPTATKPDDIVDALAAAWTARRVHLGTARWLGDLADLDDRGHRMVVAV